MDIFYILAPFVETVDIKDGDSIENAKIACEGENTCMRATGEVAMIGMAITAEDEAWIMELGSDAQLNITDTTVSVTNHGFTLTDNGKTCYMERCTCSAGDCSKPKDGKQ